MKDSNIKHYLFLMLCIRQISMIIIKVVFQRYNFITDLYIIGFMVSDLGLGKLRGTGKF